jgi:uncharacterized protein (DUF305 family)
MRILYQNVVSAASKAPLYAFHKFSNLSRMKNCLIILLFVPTSLIIGCGGSEHSSNTDHVSHNLHAHSPNAPAPADHNSMGHGNSADHSEMQSSPNASSAPLDLQFIDTMIVHHRGAVEMAMLAETRSDHRDLKALAADIVDAQEREIARMSKWRDELFAEKPTALNMQMPGMSHGMNGMDIKKLASLKDREFDIEFVRQMIPHHEGAVEMANHLRAQDSPAELKELAADIIAAQESEISQMRTWLAAWQTRK